MAVTAPYTSSKLALVAFGAFALSVLLVSEAQAQEALRRSQQQQLIQQRQQRESRVLGVSPYQDPYRREIFGSRYRDPYETVGEVPVVEQVDRFRQGVERFR